MKGGENMEKFNVGDRVKLIYKKDCCFTKDVNGKTGTLQLDEHDIYLPAWVVLDEPYYYKDTLIEGVIVELNDSLQKI